MIDRSGTHPLRPSDCVAQRNSYNARRKIFRDGLLMKCEEEKGALGCMSPCAVVMVVWFCLLPASPPPPPSKVAVAR